MASHYSTNDWRQISPSSNHQQAEKAIQLHAGEEHRLQEIGAEVLTDVDSNFTAIYHPPLYVHRLPVIKECQLLGCFFASRFACFLSCRAEPFFSTTELFLGAPV